MDRMTTGNIHVNEQIEDVNDIDMSDISRAVNYAIGADEWIDFNVNLHDQTDQHRPQWCALEAQN